MVDRFSPAARSALMSRIQRKDTGPELIVRRLLHALGYRFRTQLAGVPGRPDIAFPARRKVIQVYGCFWHAHGCALSSIPKTRSAFWEAKFIRNKDRDKRLEQAAADVGWTTLVVWECEVKDERALRQRLVEFLGPTKAVEFTAT